MDEQIKVRKDEWTSVQEESAQLLKKLKEVSIGETNDSITAQIASLK